MSTVTPPPHDAAELPPAPPERRCPRCGSALAPDQEWCLACGAAAETEVAEPRGWRVPILLAAGLVALLVIGVIVLIIALANGPEKLGASPTPTPPAAVPVVPTPTPTLAPTVTVSPGATPTTTPGATITPSPTTTTPTPATTPATSFPGWTGGDGWTIIIESATSQAKAEDVAQQAQAAGETVGILKSDDYSSLNAGYWVVFSGTYATKKDAEANLDGVRAKHKDAYVRQVKA